MTVAAQREIHFQGFWYCLCPDYRWEQNVSLRAERVRKLESVEGFRIPAPIPSRHWVLPIEDGGGEMVEMQLFATNMRLSI